MPRAYVVLASLACSSALVACAGPPFAAPIQDEPVCEDFVVGASKAAMHGTLKFPVQMRILEGKTQLQRVVLTGKAAKDGHLSRTYLPDDNLDLTIEWAQCPNELAPKPTGNAKAPTPRDAGQYECGEAAVYKTEALKTKKGDHMSHIVKFVAPPKPGCWTSEVPAEQPPPPPPPASAAPSAEPAASAAPSAEPAASATPSAAPSAAPVAIPKAPVPTP